MKTITFYSYKGGVGRTLSMSNIATRLAEFGKKVCMLDFDLEAPGVPYKFRASIPSLEFERGLVDYLHHYIQHRQAPSNIKDYIVQLKNRHNYKHNIQLIPAGNTLQKEYWRKLSALNWDKFFYEKDSTGVEFFFDLKEKIKKEINPDYLLIDSRTGITEIAGITLSLLADEVVLLSVNNEESLEGSQQVLKTILNTSNPVLNAPPKIHFVMSRIPYPEKEHFRSPKNRIVQKAKHRINGFLEKNDLDFRIEKVLTIHTDTDLQIEESLKIAYEEDEATSPIGRDYLRLFNALVEQDFTEEEKEQFKRRRTYEKLKTQILQSDNTNEQILLLNRGLEEYRDLDELFLLFQLGKGHYELKEYQKAKDYFGEIDDKGSSIYTKGWLAVTYQQLEDYENALKLHLLLENTELSNHNLLYQIAFCYKKLGQLDLLEKYLQLGIEKYPNSDRAYNGYANLLLQKEDYTEALTYIYKALELEPNNAVNNATLAEIQAHLGNDMEFYRNIALALSLNTKGIWNEIKEDPFYQKYLEEQKFLDLLERYGIDPNEDL